jgi:hypothetical protein
MEVECFLCLMLLSLGLLLPGKGAAQENSQPKWSATDHMRYRFRDVGTFGGPVGSLANDSTGTGSPSGVLNNRGSIVSGADTSIPNPNYPNVCLLCATDPLIVHAFRWQDGVLADLGALPGGNNSFANGITDNGLIAGYSETGQIDPLLGVPAIDAVLWKHGQIADLGTIAGGYESCVRSEQT